MITTASGPWRPARSTDWPSLRELLSTAEASWLTLIDRLYAGAPYWQKDVWLLDRPLPKGSLEACFYLNDAGLGMFAARGGGRDWELSNLLKGCHRRLERLYCLIGLSNQLDIFQDSLNRDVQARNDYLVMVRPRLVEGAAQLARPAQWPRTTGAGFVWRGLEFRRASEADTDALLDLQCAYESEEVLVANHRLNRALTRRALATSLREQCIYCTAAGRQMVAKAGTNGCSWHYTQIGGVFTDINWRRHGIAEHLMEAVLSEIFANGYAASLFVKLHNPAARELYRKLGFEAAESLSIAYY